MSLSLKVKRLNPNVNLPTKAGDLEAGIDFYCSKDTTLSSHRVSKLPLGFSLEIPEGWCLKLLDRSSMASSGLLVCGGVIDCTYRGEVICLLYNSNEFEYSLRTNQKIVQGLFIPVPSVKIVEVDEEFSETERGEKGFGSTDYNILGTMTRRSSI